MRSAKDDAPTPCGTRTIDEGTTDERLISVHFLRKIQCLAREAAALKRRA